MSFDRPFLFGIQPTWGKWVGQGWDWDSTMLQKMADVHCQLARVDSGWDKVEHTEGTYDWAETDHEVQATLDKGMVPLVWLTIIPPWAKRYDGVASALSGTAFQGQYEVPVSSTSGFVVGKYAHIFDNNGEENNIISSINVGVSLVMRNALKHTYTVGANGQCKQLSDEENDPPRETQSIISSFQAFHQAIANRYAASTSYFEFENETNGKGWSATEFAKWLLKARQSLLSGNPNVVLIACSTIPKSPQYLSDVYDYCIGQGVPHPFGGVACHPYPATPTGTMDTNHITDYRNVMIAKGDEQTEIWLTEYGWVWKDWPTESAGHHGYAQRIADALNKLCFGPYGYVEAALINQLLDILSSQTWRGICNNDLSPRPGYRIFGVWTKGALLPPESYAPLAVPV